MLHYSTNCNGITESKKSNKKRKKERRIRDKKQFERGIITKQNSKVSQNKPGNSNFINK